MKRMAIIFSVLAIVMLILGLVENLTNFRWAAGDQNTFFGNQRLVLNDGKVVLILTGFLVVFSAVMWVMALRKGQNDQRQR
jgi:uncharacterized membrane protein